MSTPFLELRPNRRLLDHSFEGYKLNLQSLPHWSYELCPGVDKVYADDQQYSFIHAKLFALHNHLTPDLWNHHYSFYYVDKSLRVIRITFSNDNSFKVTVVYHIPINVERTSGSFNMSIKFPASHIAVISDGTGYLHIVSTENRTYSDQLWITLHSFLVLGENKYFVVIDSRAQEIGDKTILCCLLHSVEQINEHFNSVLTWVTFESVGVSWIQRQFKQLEGKGIIHYAALETAFNTMYIISDHQFKFMKELDNALEKSDVSSESRNIIYTWLQTTEDITITLKLDKNYNKNLLHVDISPLKIKVSYAGNILIDGKLSKKIDGDLTTWNIQDYQMDILVTKSESGLWDVLIEGGDENGEQIMDPSLVEEVHRRLAHLCAETEVGPNNEPLSSLSAQELEECDIAPQEDTVLARIDLTDQTTTHKVSLSTHNYLFSVDLDVNEASAIAIRHDVDACVWQPYVKGNAENWPLTHQGTLLAFGYVQSSKQDRKFITCPPNFSYSVVCESTRHIFVYKSVTANDSQLRKRGPDGAKNVKVGQQYVFNVEKYGEVLGIHAANSHLFLLTATSFVSIEIM